MKPLSPRQSEGLRNYHRKARLTGACLCLTLAVCAAWAQANTATKAAGSSGTNAPPADAPVPKSQFVLPRSAPEGRDPFFPRSTRPYNTTPVVISPTVTNVAPVTVSVDLKLNGISGTQERRLAIINNHTFEAGEDGEVNTPTGRFRIRCVEIRADAVVVFVGGERRELRLRQGL